MMVTTTR